MHRGRGLRLGVLVAVGVALACWAAAAEAELGGTVTHTEPAGALVMPFDVTSGKASFEEVIRSGATQVPGSIATHWAYWAADCSHLADVVICLTPNDTIVVDPTALQNVVQGTGETVGAGPTVDLSGSRGMLTVTAYQTDNGPQGHDCRIASPLTPLNNVLVGSWTIANTKTNAGYGGDAIGFTTNGVFPDPAILADGGLRIPTLDPESLTDSQVIVIPVKFPGGNGQYTNTELGPLSKVTCDNAFVDNLENSSSLPNVTFKCVGFNPIATLAGQTGGDPPIIPPTFNLTSSGYVHFRNCRTSKGILGSKKFIFAFHTQAVGPFGTVVSGKYTNIAE